MPAAKTSNLQDECSNSVESQSDDGHDPMYISTSCPPKPEHVVSSEATDEYLHHGGMIDLPEKAHRQKPDREEGWNKAMFLCPQTVLLDVWLQVVVLIGEINAESDDTSDNDACEYQSQFPKVKSVRSNVDQWEGLEETVIGPIDDTGEDVGVKNGWILNTDDQGDDQSVIHHCTELLVASINFSLGADFVVTCQCTQSFCTTKQYVIR